MTKGLVYRTSDGYVLYKFETEDLPTLNAGEDYALREDINSIEVGAIYDPNTDTYVNPPPPKPGPPSDAEMNFKHDKTLYELNSLITNIDNNNITDADIIPTMKKLALTQKTIVETLLNL